MKLWLMARRMVTSDWCFILLVIFMLDTQQYYILGVKHVTYIATIRYSYLKCDATVPPIVPMVDIGWI